MVEVFRQNPRFGVTPTSALPGLIFSAANGRNTPEWNAHYDQEQQERQYRSALRGFIHGWFPDHPVGIDKSRGWIGKWPALKDLYDTPPRMIAPIRDLRGIVASMEKKVLANPHFQNWPPEWRGKTHTLAQRVEMYISTAPLGPVLESIRERLEQQDGGDILYVRAEDFCADPQSYMNIMYQYLGEEYFDHDVENVTQGPVELDSAHGSIFADHTIRQGAITPLEQDWRRYFGEDIDKMLFNRFPWFYQTFYPHVLQQQAA
jgi:sulfotransferase